jgi:hypothetical protein
MCNVSYSTDTIIREAKKKLNQKRKKEKYFDQMAGGTSEVKTFAIHPYETYLALEMHHLHI